MHEIKPRGYGDWPAALAFALRLAVRRVASWPAESGLPPSILWCQPAAHAGELGRLYAPGLEDLGLPLETVLMVETQRASEALWAMEEGLRSRALALVIGQIDKADLTSSRRLGLAAAAGRTPILLLSGSSTAAAPAAMTRWRVGRRTSHPFDRLGMVLPRIELALERCRGRALFNEVSQIVEWCDAARCFRLAASLADRAPREGAARLSSP